METVLKVNGTFPILYKSLKVSLKKRLVCHFHQRAIISSQNLGDWTAYLNISRMPFHGPTLFIYVS